MDAKHLAPALVLPLLFEFCHAEESIDHRHTLNAPSLDSGSHSLFAAPHTHFDIESDERETTAAPFSVSGAREDEPRFVLHVVPRSSGFLLMGRPTPTFRTIPALQPLPSLQQPAYELAEAQPMYRVIADVEELVAVLEVGLNIFDVQMAAIRKSALEGAHQEVGGYGGGNVERLYTRQQLEGVGLTFRPPEELPARKEWQDERMPAPPVGQSKRQFEDFIFVRKCNDPNGFSFDSTHIQNLESYRWTISQQCENN